MSVATRLLKVWKIQEGHRTGAVCQLQNPCPCPPPIRIPFSVPIPIPVPVPSGGIGCLLFSRLFEWVNQVGVNVQHRHLERRRAIRKRFLYDRDEVQDRNNAQ